MSDPAEILEFYCPECGYNLHGIQSNRCPECGQEVDRSATTTSRIPWTHRHEIGRVKAWRRTVWMATFRQAELARCVAAPVPYSDARRFWLVNVAIALCALVPLYIYGAERIDASVTVPSFTASPAWGPGMLDLAVPWLTVNSWTISISAVIACVATIMGVQTYLAGRCGPSRRMQDRAAALGLYASGAWIGSALVGGVLGVGSMGVLLVVIPSNERSPDAFRQCFEAGLLPFAAVLLLLSGAAIWHLIRKLGRLGPVRSLRLAGLIPLCWILILVLFGFIYPWCLGLVWLMLKSV